MKMLLKKFNYILLVFYLLNFTGCVSMPTQEEINNFDYGASLTIDYEKAIKEYFEPTLFDPYSAVYKFGTPQKYWYKLPPLRGGDTYTGYLVCVDINAKNRMGGYVGNNRFGFLFKNDQIIYVMNPSELRMLR